MTDISDVEVNEYEVGSIKVRAVMPKSDEKKVVIPSPPITRMIPINPRPAIIFITENAVSDELKVYAKENKQVFIIPVQGSAEEIAEVYSWAVSKKALLNIKSDEISVKADAGGIDLANALVDILQDDTDIGDAELLAL
jgi:hypothetical protein